jgi:general secretion pathway protein K
MALVLVLWTMALLAFLAVGFVSATRSELQIVRNQLEAARARSIADAGVALAILGMLDPASETRWPNGGEERTLVYADGTARISLEDEHGKIDLNTAAPELLTGLLEQLGVPDGDAADLGASVTEWKRARLSSWAAASRGSSPAPSEAPRPFAVIEELRRVPGMTPTLFRRVAPFVTVHSQLPGVNPATAPAEVLRGLPRVNAREVEAYLQARVRSDPDNALPSLSGVQAYLSISQPQAVMVRSQGVTAAGTTFVREAIVVLTRVSGAPFRVVSWRQGYPAAGGGG